MGRLSDRLFILISLRETDGFSFPQDNCDCIKIIGHLEAVKWMLWPRKYRPSPGFLSLGDWIRQPHIWLHYVESTQGVLPDDDALVGTDTRYWSIHDVQRYFLGDLHCEKILFPYQYPNLRLPTKHGCYQWRANTALKVPSFQFKRECHTSMMFSLQKMKVNDTQLDRLIVSDQLINLDRLDCFRRAYLFKYLHEILSVQDRLQLVSLENLCCTRLEGVRFIQQLACFNAETLKYLFLWRFVLLNENPLLINYRYLTGPGLYIPRPSTYQCFIRSLAQLKNLRILALEYSHIADGSGSALVLLLPIMKKPHFRLQLICREEYIPGHTDAALGSGGYGIPDTAWKNVSVACPDLNVLIAFFRIRDYDDVRRFLTPSIPVTEVHLHYGIDLLMKQRQDSDVHCFIRHIAYQYSNTLVSLSIHQWRYSTYPLYHVLELMPRLAMFDYVGMVEDEVDLRRLLSIVSCGVLPKMKHVRVQVQDEESKRKYWQSTVKTLNEEFQEIVDLFNIHFSLAVYKS